MCIDGRCESCGECGEPCCEDGSCHGWLCDDGICSHMCSPEGALRCTGGFSGGDRLRCGTVFGCRMWLSAGCGWGEECCSQTPQYCAIAEDFSATPRLVEPLEGALVSKRNAVFTWSTVGSAYRYRLAVCSGPGLTGECQLVEAGLVGQTTWQGEVTVPISNAGSWSVRAFTECDLQVGPYESPRGLRIGP